MKTLVASAVSLLVGLGLGWLAFHADPVVQTLETKTVEPVVVQVPSSAPAAPAARREGEVALPAAAVRPVAPPPGISPIPALPLEQEVEVLRAKVAKLEATLENETSLRADTEGRKVPVPAGLPARLRDEKLLVSTFNAALKEAGFPGQVTSVDCSEHPCLVFGYGFGDRGDMEKLNGASAFAPYAKDSMATFGFHRGGPNDDDPQSRFFAVGVLPGDSESSDEQRKRLAFRVRQMEEASRPKKER